MLATANGLKESLGEYWTDGLVILWLKPRSGTRRFNQRPPSTSVREIISSNGGFNLRFCIPGDTFHTEGLGRRRMDVLAIEKGASAVDGTRRRGIPRPGRADGVRGHRRRQLRHRRRMASDRPDGAGMPVGGERVHGRRTVRDARMTRDAADGSARNPRIMSLETAKGLDG